MNMRGVIGTNFGDKKFGSVGSKIDQKMVNMDQKGGMRGQVKKNMNKDFLSQVSCVRIYCASEPFSVPISRHLSDDSFILKSAG